MPDKSFVIIEIRGGVAQEIYASPDVQPFVVDYDQDEGKQVGKWHPASIKDAKESSFSPLETILTEGKLPPELERYISEEKPFCKLFVPVRLDADNFYELVVRQRWIEAIANQRCLKPTIEYPENGIRDLIVDIPQTQLASFCREIFDEDNNLVFNCQNGEQESILRQHNLGDYIGDRLPT